MDTSVGLTVEGLVELKRKMDELNKGCRHEAPIYGHSLLPSLFGGIDIIKSNYLPTRTETYEEEVELTFRERWIEPLLHGATLPFEPWVKTKWVTKTRQVPEPVCYMVGNQLLMSSFAYGRLRNSGIISNIVY